MKQDRLALETPSKMDLHAVPAALRNTRTFRLSCAAFSLLTLTYLPALAVDAPPLTPAFLEIADQRAKIWTEMPLAFSAALFVESPATGYGQYVPRANAVFSPSDVISVYLEPVGYAFKAKDTQKSINFTADFQVQNTQGQVLIEGKNFTSIEHVVRTPLYEYQASFSFEFDGLRPGSYILALTLKDENSDKNGELKLPFDVEPASQ